MKDLTVVMPVYNEEEIISVVIEDWIENLKKLKIDFIIKTYNDGSKDNTLNVLQELENQYPELKVAG